MTGDKRFYNRTSQEICPWEWYRWRVNIGLGSGLGLRILDNVDLRVMTPRDIIRLQYRHRSAPLLYQTLLLCSSHQLTENLDNTVKLDWLVGAVNPNNKTVIWVVSTGITRVFRAAIYTANPIHARQLPFSINGLASERRRYKCSVFPYCPRPCSRAQGPHLHQRVCRRCQHPDRRRLQSRLCRRPPGRSWAPRDSCPECAHTTGLHTRHIQCFTALVFTKKVARP